MTAPLDLGVRLDALLDELVLSGWSGEFDARERAALARLGYVPAAALEAAQADNERLREALTIIADGTSYDPAGAIGVRARNIAAAALRLAADRATGVETKT